MKLLIVTPRFLPESFSIGPIAETLCYKGHDVTVLTGRPNYGVWKFYKGYEQYTKFEIINGIKIIRIKEKLRKQNNLSLLINYLDCRRKFKKELKRVKGGFDALISIGLSPLVCLEYTGKYCKKHKIPNLMYGLDLWPESFVAASFTKKGSLIYKIIKKYSIKLYRQFDEIVYASPSALEYIKSNLGIDTKFKHIYQPCLTKIPDGLNEYNHNYVKDEKMHILYCGTIAKFIHLDLMIEALAICDERDNIVFDVVGSGIELEKMIKLVEEKGLSGIVRFHGRVSREKTADYYKNADVLYCPLYWNCETSNMIPQKLIEYFMYGRPILGMIKGDGADLIKNASKLNVVCNQTPCDICNSLKKLLSYEKQQLLNCGEENKQFYRNNKRFKLDVVCDELIDEINKLCIYRKS